jgi:tyrosyl-tRNA synthetase
VDALTLTKLAASKGEARRGLEQKGFSINGEQAAADRVLSEIDVRAGKYIVLQKGKRNYSLIEIRD